METHIDLAAADGMIISSQICTFIFLPEAEVQTCILIRSRRARPCCLNFECHSLFNMFSVLSLQIIEIQDDHNVSFRGIISFMIRDRTFLLFWVNLFFIALHFPH